MKTISIFIGLYLSISSVAIAQTPNINSATTAIKNLVALKQNTSILKAKINGLNYGPYNLSMSCKICTEHIIWCVEYEKYTYSWTFPDYNYCLSNFKNITYQLLNDVSTFDKYYQPLEDWFLNTLPNINTDFQTLKSSNSGNILANLQKASKDVSGAKSKLNTAISNLGNWSNTVQGDFNSISYNSENMQSFITIDSNKIRKYMTGMACGSNTLYNDWVNTKNTAQDQVTKFLVFAASYGVSTKSINQNLGSIIGPLITIQFKLNDILAKLEKAEITSSAAVRMINTIIAENVWSDLEYIAKSNF